MDTRTELYFTLSECYKEPVEAFARNVAEGVLYQAMANGFRVLGISQGLEPLYIAEPPEAVLQILKQAYYPLFVIPPHFVLPVESVFKEWTGEEGFLAGSRDMIMGPPAVDMLRRYQEREILIPPSFKDYPDHLALLMEYGGLLCEEGGKWRGEKGKGKMEGGKGKGEKGIGEQGRREQGEKGRRVLGRSNPKSEIRNPKLKREQGKFVASHLDTWIEEFAQQVHSRTESPFYRTVAVATVAFIQAERRHLEITVP